MSIWLVTFVRVNKAYLSDWQERGLLKSPVGGEKGESVMCVPHWAVPLKPSIECLLWPLRVSVAQCPCVFVPTEEAHVLIPFLFGFSVLFCHFWRQRYSVVILLETSVPQNMSHTRGCKEVFHGTWSVDGEAGLTSFCVILTRIYQLTPHPCQQNPDVT